MQHWFTYKNICWPISVMQTDSKCVYMLIAGIVWCWSGSFVSILDSYPFLDTVYIDWHFYHILFCAPLQVSMITESTEKCRLSLMMILFCFVLNTTWWLYWSPCSHLVDCVISWLHMRIIYASTFICALCVCARARVCVCVCICSMISFSCVQSCTSIISLYIACFYCQ